MRLVFMGTPEFAVPSLIKLLNGSHQVIAVVTQPDRPKGRNGVMTPPPVKQAAGRAGVRVIQPASAREEAFRRELTDLEPDLVVTVAYGQILLPEVLAVPRMGCINLHASLLPLYRGAAPIHRAVINGDPVTGATTMYMDEGMDTGDIILQAALPIRPEDTTGEVHDRLADIGARLLEDTVNLIAAGHAPRRPQEGRYATCAPRLTRADEIIYWDKPAREVVNLVRGMNPWPGAYTTAENKEVKILRALVHDLPGQGNAGPFVPGEVREIIRDRGFTVRTGDGGSVLVREVQPSGKRPMDAVSFVNGYRINPGLVFGRRGPG